MAVNEFNRDEMARWYATRHLRTDPGIRDVYYLPGDAPPTEIRCVEVNELIAVRDKDPLEPLDVGVDVGGAAAHTFMVLDVTPAQWEKIAKEELPLPSGWSLSGAVHFSR